jgi:glycosyltransferase involved in cell wall biosynthesis
LAIARELVRLEPSYQFVVAGSGPQEQTLKAAAAQHSLPVRWLGNLPTLDSFFSEIDCFLLTSDFEGLPMVLLEALQREVPVVATAVDGSATYFHDVALMLEPTATPIVSARTIRQYLDDEKLVQQHVVLGKERVRERFSAERQIRTIESRYLALVESKQRAKAATGVT